jgi:hypothetical protein
VTLHPEEALKLAGILSELTRLRVYPRSLSRSGGTLFFLGREGQTKWLGVLAEDGAACVSFVGTAQSVHLDGRNAVLMRGETNPANAAALRAALPHLVAQPLGLCQSAGCGDRLGLATPGHVRAARHSSLAPIFAQQSMRENARTGRTPQAVLDDAGWGAFQEGWQAGFGADADHLKTTTDLEACVAAGYTLYTVDPGEYVDNGANTDTVNVLQEKVAALPWNVLDSSHEATRRLLCRRPIDLGSFSLAIGEEQLLRAEAKYGRAVAHTLHMYQHLSKLMEDRSFELEMSVDETETVTTLAEHVYIAHELRRLGVRWVSLAPRYVGSFEKGVDYIGDLGAFERAFDRHLAVAHAFGPYKLSLHSGSDKFSIYPIAARLAGPLVHLKTAGTSYLEALRAIAAMNPALFREIVAFAINRYFEDRATYHVSADPARMPDVSSAANQRLTEVLDDFHAREVLHVTYGSVLQHRAFRTPIFETLRVHEETYYDMLERHFVRHFAPFLGAGAAEPGRPGPSAEGRS